MKRNEFKALIDAPPSRVWEVLWSNTTYPSWTAAFMEGSRVVSDKPSEEDIWRKGNRIRFLGPDNEGMFSEVADNRFNEFMSFRHLGVVTKGIADLDSAQAKQWAGSMENYSLRNIDGQTELTVAMDITDEYLKYFQEAWPQALQKIKQLAEERR
jgi:ribosome-associated toxin RatA of RatAB toxin-antitoxin module